MFKSQREKTRQEFLPFDNGIYMTALKYLEDIGLNATNETQEIIIARYPRVILQKDRRQSFRVLTAFMKDYVVHGGVVHMKGDEFYCCNESQCPLSNYC